MFSFFAYFLINFESDPDGYGGIMWCVWKSNQIKLGDRMSSYYGVLYMNDTKSKVVHAHIKQKTKRV